MSRQAPILFVDSNVLIEAVFIPLSAAAIVTDLAANGTFSIATCALAVIETEKAILNKVRDTTELENVIKRWELLKSQMRLNILPDPSFDEVKEAYEKYIGAMRHKADIPILASALSCSPAPFVILSANRVHFNDMVSVRCGIKILSCTELLELLSSEPGD